MPVRLLALVVLPVLAAGCSCNETEFAGFPSLETETHDPPTSMGSWLSFDVAPDGKRLTMAFYDRDKTAVGYAVGAAQADGSMSWVHEPVDGYPASNGLDPGDFGKYTSQRTAPDGTVWVSYYDAKVGGLRIAHRTGPSEWGEPTVVDGGTGLPGSGLWTSLAIGADGNPVVAHCTGTGTVKLSRFADGSWSTTDLYTSDPVTVVDEQGVEQVVPAGVAYTAIAVSETSEIVAFQDTASGDLHVVTDGADEIVDSDGLVGAWPSIWTDGTKVRVAYQDEGAQDLLLATRQDAGSEWSVDAVDEGDMRGADTAVWEVAGEPQILYFDGMDNDLWIAKRSGSTWTTERLGEDGAAVGFHNEVATVDGSVWVGSYDYTNDGLFLKRL